MRRKHTQLESIPMIRSSVVNQVIDAILAQPNGASFLRQQHGIREPKANLYEQIPLSRYLSLFEHAAVVAKDPLLGARIGFTNPPGELLGPIGFLVLTSPSLRIGLEHLSHYIRAWQDTTDIKLHLGEDTATWSYRINSSNLWPRRQDSEFTLSATCSMIRACFGEKWIPYEVHFEHHRPQEWRELERMFRSKIRFDQSDNALVLELNDLDRPLSNRTSSGFAPFLRKHIEDILADEPETIPLEHQVRQIISRDLGKVPVNLTSLSAELGIPARTLQRHLAEQGTSVREIIRKLKQQEARTLLTQSNRHIGTVSQAVGYTDQAAFWRAFKSWEGVSPADYQRAKRKKR
jgi:AraC-like DNA-binding protein